PGAKTVVSGACESLTKWAGPKPSGKGSIVLPEASKISVQLTRAGLPATSPFNSKIWQLREVLPPLQDPAWQVSPLVQVFPSLQEIPSAFGGLEQLPKLGSQTPAS